GGSRGVRLPRARRWRGGRRGATRGRRAHRRSGPRREDARSAPLGGRGGLGHLGAPPVGHGLRITDRTEGMDPIVKEQDAPVSLAEKNALGAGRIGVYTALGAAIGVVPLPWIPDTIARRVRG